MGPLSGDLRQPQAVSLSVPQESDIVPQIGLPISVQAMMRQAQQLGVDCR